MDGKMEELDSTVKVYSWVPSVESGRVMLSLKMLLKIKQRFVCTLDEIVDQEGYKELLNSKNKLRRFRLVRCDE